MINSLRDLSAAVKSLDKRLREAKGVQVGSNKLRSVARDLVDEYFRIVRDRLMLGKMDGDDLRSCDSQMHSLLELSHRKSSLKRYRVLLKGISIQLVELEKKALVANSPPTYAKPEPVDELITKTLSKLVPSAAISYQQAIRDILDHSRISWRGQAADLRESLRETLDFLAPDDRVTEQDTFKLEKGANGPTMKQKVAFILNSRGLKKAERKSPELTTQAIDEIVGSMVRSVYSRLSVSTHTVLDRNEILRVRDWVRVVMCEILEIRVDA